MVQQASEDAIMPELLEFVALRDAIRKSALQLKSIFIPRIIYIFFKNPFFIIYKYL